MTPLPACPFFRLLFVVSGASLTLGDLTLTNGVANSDGTGLGGGGIYSAGTLTLNNVEVLRNASGASGGGVSNRGGTVLVDSSEISHNTAVAAGGGLLNLNGTVSVTATTFSFNASTIDADPGRGGAIANHAVGSGASLDLSNVVITDNRVDGLGGGGLDNAAGTGQTASVTIADSIISRNSANGLDHTEGLGGGVQNSFFRQQSDATVELTIDRTTISDNTAVDGGGISNGFDVSANLVATLVLTNSTVIGNVVEGSGFVVGTGGGVYNVNGQVTVANSTISGNAANGQGSFSDFSGMGGGLANIALSAPSEINLIHTTVVDNVAVGLGGGVANLQFNTVGAVSLLNTLIAGNTAPSQGSCFNFLGTLTSLGHNLEDQNNCQLGQVGDLPSTDPLVGLILDNGGPTTTHALLPGSPAVDAADAAACAAPPVNGTDQRGLVRPRGTDCDIGAYEADWAPLILTLDTQYFLNDGSSGQGRYALLTPNQYVDEFGFTGSWFFLTSPARLLFQADPGTNCDLVALGTFFSATQLVGGRVCQDGSGLGGLWTGTIPSAELGLLE